MQKQKKYQKVPKDAKKVPKGNKKEHKKSVWKCRKLWGGEVPKKNSKCQKKVPIAPKKYPKKRRSKKGGEKKKYAKKIAKKCQKVP